MNCIHEVKYTKITSHNAGGACPVDGLVRNSGPTQHLKMGQIQQTQSGPREIHAAYNSVLIYPIYCDAAPGKKVVFDGEAIV